jgi:hypothetical protein
MLLDTGIRRKKFGEKCGLHHSAGASPDCEDCTVSNPAVLKESAGAAEMTVSMPGERGKILTNIVN